MILTVMLRSGSGDRSEQGSYAVYRKVNLFELVQRLCSNKHVLFKYVFSSCHICVLE